MSFGGEGDWNSILVVVNGAGRGGGVERTHGGCEDACGAGGVRGGEASWATVDDASLCKRASSSLARILCSGGGVTDISARRTIGVLIWGGSELSLSVEAKIELYR